MTHSRLNTILRVSLACLVLCLACVSRAQAEKYDALKPQGYVNDFGGVIDAVSRQQITALCQELEQKAHAQIAVVTVRSLEGVPIEDFSVRLAQKWGVGYKKESRGVLILLAVEDRKYRVEVGYDVEPILPDGKVGGFGREMVPLLRQGNYGAALLQLTSQMAQVIALDRGVDLTNTPTPASRGDTGRHIPGSLLVVLAFWLIAWFLGVMRRLMFGTPRRGRRGYIGGPWWWGGLGGGTWGSGGSSGGWGGGSGGGGFGGFGGGSFGGGGASGSW